MSLVNHTQFGRCGERFSTAALPVPVQHPGCPTDFAPNLELRLVLDRFPRGIVLSPCAGVSVSTIPRRVEPVVCPRVPRGPEVGDPGVSTSLILPQSSDQQMSIKVRPYHPSSSNICSFTRTCPSTITSSLCGKGANCAKFRETKMFALVSSFHRSRRQVLASESSPRSWRSR